MTNALYINFYGIQNEFARFTGSAGYHVFSVNAVDVIGQGRAVIVPFGLRDGVVRVRAAVDIVEGTVLYKGDSLRAGPLHENLPQLDEQHPRLVHFKAALVGSQDTCLLLQEMRPYGSRGFYAGKMSRMRLRGI